jgi:hypothetical protein
LSRIDGSELSRNAYRHPVAPPLRIRALFRIALAAPLATVVRVSPDLPAGHKSGNFHILCLSGKGRRSVKPAPFLKTGRVNSRVR